ncbi:farnesylcysteine lyase isoform X2 [Diospyros lotus]|uniref:farnesylcysteine lyase isoform X2 n=1 Tax=Diospyros lotus TaxID=55363 RepID=UPI00224E2281|nr:farnesylcysteine lyase isoform X2 [Diospyros lotus]
MKKKTTTTTTMLGVFMISLLIISNPSLSFSQQAAADDDDPTGVCIIGSGIAGSSVAHFLRHYSDHSSPPRTIRIFERHSVVGGRMATVSLAGQTFEAGASILHPKNYHALNYAKSLNLSIRKPSPSSFSLGIWDGHRFIFKTLTSHSKFPFLQKIVSLTNSFLMFFRYGFSLFRMGNFVKGAVDSFLKYYESFESRPVFETVDEMLKWAGLQNLTARTLQEELVDAGLSTLLIQELVTVITRINYGQSVDISGLAGAVSLAGSGGGLWAIEGGNWQMASGLIKSSNVSLHLQEEIKSISYLGNYYELNSTKGNSYNCEVTVVAAPLDELNIHFMPAISIPKRKLQHTHTTFVRGLLNPAYFGLSEASEIPELVGTIESSDIPFSSISLLKQQTGNDMSYKIFSRAPLADAFLDSIFRTRIQG